MKTVKVMYIMGGDDMKYPCKDCNEREIGCHTNCEGYLQKRKEQDTINAYIRNDIAIFKEIAERTIRVNKLRRIHR